MRTTLNQKNFSAGQIARDLWGRTDSAKYQSGLKKLRNCFINKRGILYNSPGTQTIMPDKFPTKLTRSITFKFSFNQQFELIFGDKYLHIIQNGVPVFNQFFFPQSAQISNFPNGVNPTITMMDGSGKGVTSVQIQSGMLVQLKPFSTLGVPPPIQDSPLASNDFSLFCYNRWFIVKNVAIGPSSTTFQLTDLYGNNIDSTTWGAYSGNLQISTVYEVTTPYVHTDLALIKYKQSFDIVQLRHHSYPRYQLSRQGTTSWNLTINTGWPSQTQQANNLGATGGGTGGPYYYKITTYNKTTKKESLPCPVATLTNQYKQNIISASMNFDGANYAVLIKLPTVVGLSVGKNIYVSFEIEVSAFPKPLVLLTAGVGYQIVGIDAVNNLVSVYGNFISNLGAPTVQVGTYAYTLASVATSTIASITNTNPITITTVNTHGLTNGQELTIQGLGVVGLDGLTFNATVLGASTFSLNGVNGSNYTLPVAIPSNAYVSPTALSSANAPSVAAPITVTGSISNPSIYTSDIIFLVYASNNLNSGFGFIGSIIPSTILNTFSFVDKGIPPDSTLTPKSYTPLFIGTGNYPSDCNYYQQRLVELSTDNNPQGLFASVIGDYNDFTIRNPIRESDAIILDVWSNEMQQIFGSVDSGFLVLITDAGPMVAAGDNTGVFTPSTDLIKRYAFAGGAQNPRPLHIFKNIVYLEANLGCIRDLEVLVTPFYTYIDKSDDVSLFSEDLIQNNTITAWDYKQYPDSQIMATRLDGTALSITYFQEQQIQAFSWMDTNNGRDSFLDVACAQEGTETYAYWTVKRQTGTWIERMASRYFTDPTTNAIFTHGTASYNGLVNDGTTATLTGAITANGVITANLSNNNGQSYTVGWQVNFKYIYGYDQYGNVLFYTARMKVTGTTTNTVTGTLFEAINPAMIGPTIYDIRVCSNVVGGLWHLNGQQVSVVADGFVIANPYDSLLPVLTVTNGKVVLPGGNAYGVINIGLPYLSDVQTLDIDEEKGETFMDKLIGVHKVAVKFLETGDLWVGPNFSEYLPGKTKMDRFPMRDSQDGYLTPTKLFTGIKQIPIDSNYGYGGSFALRNLSPLPMTILKIAPQVQVQS